MLRHYKYINRVESKGRELQKKLHKPKVVYKIKYDGPYSPIIRSTLIFFKKFIKYYVYTFVGSKWKE